MIVFPHAWQGVDVRYGADDVERPIRDIAATPPTMERTRK